MTNKKRLSECHQDLQKLAYKQGESKASSSQGKHTTYPSLALDIYPFPISNALNSKYSNRRFALLAKVFLANANKKERNQQWKNY
tara:strand:+ start:174 stop:428 length:255 start_codon:yes stop_codon:yes gene_type:complete